MTPQEYVQSKAAASGSSFYYAFLFLPPARRQAITAFYAFCREVDDVVDEVHDPGVAAAKLGWWAQEVERAFAGAASHPAMLALMPHCPSFGIRPEHLLAVVEGCRIDLNQNRFWIFRRSNTTATWWPAWWARWRPISSDARRSRPYSLHTALGWPCS